jgi:glyoxylase-like metal-dependent hydrolase (beta-lactamase superfamily II)
VRPGTLPATWITGGPNCLEVPDFQVHEYNPDLFILRESGCINYEKPFLYLFFGTDKALLYDTGAGQTVPTGRVVSELIAKWSKRANRTTPIPLIVAHSHAHGDHTAGDAQMKALPNTTVIGTDVASVQSFFGFKAWPRDIVQYDLGGRVLDVIGIPGHENASIAIYDRQTGVLLTGDTVYPGRLYVRDAPTFTASIERLVEFTKDKPVTHVLGTHIEQSATPFLDYKVGTTYQPNEHKLELSRGHLLEIVEAMHLMGDKVRRYAMRDLTVYPR